MVVIKIMQIFKCMYHISSTVYYPDQQMHSYIFIIFYIFYLLKYNRIYILKYY